MTPDCATSSCRPRCFAREKVLQSIVRLLGLFQQIHQGLVLAARDHEQSLIQQRLFCRQAGAKLLQAAVGAHLLNTAPAGMTVSYWRERKREAQFNHGEHGGTGRNNGGGKFCSQMVRTRLMSPAIDTESSGYHDRL